MTQDDALPLKLQLRSLSERISQWKAGLNEADTKRTLIEPLLAALGWDLGNPGEVRAEHTVAARRVDYALRVGGEPKVFVEAKAHRDGHLPARDAAQLIRYCATEGVRWGLLTDGSTYQLYDSFSTLPLAKKLVFSLSLSRLPEDADEESWQVILLKLSIVGKDSVSNGKMEERVLALKETEELAREAEEGAAASTETDPHAEKEVWALVEESYIHLKPLYEVLRRGIASRVPGLRAELDPSGGKGWVKLRLPPERRRGKREYAQFKLALKTTTQHIEIWFTSLKVTPTKKAVEARGLETRIGNRSGNSMDRKTSKGFYITREDQIDSDVLSWLERAM